MPTAPILALHSDEASLVFEQNSDSGVVWRHCGARVDPAGIAMLAELRGPATFSLDCDILHPLVPPAGLGWFGPPLLSLRDGEGQPISFAPSETSCDASDTRLEFSAHDDCARIGLELSIETLHGGAFRFGTSLINESDRAIQVAALASAQFPLPPASSGILSWRGRHNAELAECREAMPDHRWERVTRRGISGHGGPPGLYVLGAQAGWDDGLVFAPQLAWSGDSELSIERDDEGYWHCTLQAVHGPGEIVLEPGETYAAPPVILALSRRGRNGAMAQHHAAVRAMVRWPGGSMPPRPVHLNSWEACYFAHDAGRMERLAKAGAEIGVERFVLDDGWFKGRRNDTAGLGDWTPDPETYRQGLGPLADAVTDMGLEFGLWVEPEMVNPDSDLYRTHPDWALASPGRGSPTARNQLVLDMRRGEVRDHLFQCLDALLASAPIAYLKWDQNRDHAPSGGSRQTQGTYALLDRVRAAHPRIEIEGCAGGGGRSDAGMAQHVHRFWTSDNIDAVARVGMQRGFLAFLPPEMMGSHVGASPAHATGRSQAMGFRAAIACMGHFGVELDPERLDAEERDALAGWIGFYKQWRHLLHGTRVHMGDGPDGLRWQAHGTGRQKLLFCIRTSPAQDRRPQPLPLPFAGAEKRWQATLLRLAETPQWGSRQAKLFGDSAKEPIRLAGSWLAHAGLPLPAQSAESVAIFLLEAAE